MVLTLEEPALAFGAAVVVTGPSGEVQQGSPRLLGRTVSQDLRSGAPAGTYTVSWRVTSGDGHPISGRFSFTARSAAPSSSPEATTGTPGPPTQPGAGRVPAWLWLVGGLALVLVAPRAAQRFGTPRRP